MERYEKGACNWCIPLYTGCTMLYPCVFCRHHQCPTASWRLGKRCAMKSATWPPQTAPKMLPKGALVIGAFGAFVASQWLHLVCPTLDEVGFVGPRYWTGDACSTEVAEAKVLVPDISVPTYHVITWILHSYDSCIIMYTHIYIYIINYNHIYSYDLLLSPLSLIVGSNILPSGEAHQKSCNHHNQVNIPSKKQV